MQKGWAGGSCIAQRQVWAEALSEASETKLPLLTSLANLALQKACLFVMRSLCHV